MSAPKEMIGLRFGRLRVVASAPSDPATTRPKLRWECVCDCGSTVVVVGDRLRIGQTTSCGCFRRERQREASTTHGQRSRPEYGVWKGMWQRCTNPQSDAYRYYGGRGITVCDRWRDFAAFLADMGPRPSAVHQIDRVDNDGDYEPGNCRWATREEQAANTTQAILLEVDGETMPVGAACRKTGLGRKVVVKRYRRVVAQG